MMPDSGVWDTRVAAWWGVPVGMMAEVWICRMRGMRVGAVGAGVRRAALGMTGEGPVMMRGACAASEKASAATQSETEKSNRQRCERKGNWRLTLYNQNIVNKSKDSKNKVKHLTDK